MGRLAGPISRTAQLRLDATQREIELQRRYIASITPLAYPSSRRRQAALLWLVFEERGLVIGRRNRPPLTADMRALLAKRYLRLRRQPPVYVSEPERLPGIGRYNLLSLTPGGEAALVRMKVPEIDRIYILRALYTGVLQ
jgi:hypothetical protein